MDEFAAYEQFIAHQIQHDESIDDYLAKLQKLAVLFGAVSDCTHMCTFVAELPVQVKQLLCTSVRMQLIDQMLVCTQVILKDDILELTEVVAAATQTKRLDIPVGPHTNITCYPCNGPNHLTEDCLSCQMAYHIQGRQQDL